MLFLENETSLKLVAKVLAVRVVVVTATIRAAVASSVVAHSGSHLHQATVQVLH